MSQGEGKKRGGGGRKKKRKEKKEKERGKRGRKGKIRGGNGGGGGGEEKNGGGETNWRPGIEPGTSVLENLRKCHKNNSSNNNKVTMRSCELLELMGKTSTIILLC